VAVPLRYITASPGFSYVEGGWHPYVATLQEYVADPQLRYDDSALCRTFSTFVPTNAQEALLENVDRVLFPLHRLPPRVAGHEWWLTRAEVERAIRGSPPRWMHQGKRVFGPVDDAEACREFDQLIRVYRSVGEHGVRPELSSDPIRGYFLVRDDDYRFVLTGGQHRVAALRLLGEEELTVRIDGLRAVREDELYRWTEEHGGPYPAEIAHLIFDKLFDEDGLSKARNLGIMV
jgi:hypothetical protein